MPPGGTDSDGALTGISEKVKTVEALSVVPTSARRAGAVSVVFGAVTALTGAVTSVIGAVIAVTGAVTAVIGAVSPLIGDVTRRVPRLVPRQP